MARTVQDTIEAHRAFVEREGTVQKMIDAGDTPEEAQGFVRSLLADRLIGHTVPELRSHITGRQEIAHGGKQALIDHIADNYT